MKTLTGTEITFKRDIPPKATSSPSGSANKSVIINSKQVVPNPDNKVKVTLINYFLKRKQV